MRVSIPNLIDQHVETTRIVQERREEFWGRNRDLLENLPEAAVFRRQTMMMNIMNDLYSKNPTYTYEDLAADTETELRATLGVAPVNEAQTKPQAKKRKNRAKKFPSATSRQNRNQSPQKAAANKNSPENVLTRGKGFKPNG